MYSACFLGLQVEYDGVALVLLFSFYVILYDLVRKKWYQNEGLGL